MAHCPDYEEFEALRQDVAQIKAENAFLRSLLLGMRWLSKPQTLKAMDVSETTLWRMTKEDRIKHYKEGSKFFYDVDAVRDYLLMKKFSKTAADNRIITACYVNHL